MSDDTWDLAQATPPPAAASSGGAPPATSPTDLLGQLIPQLLAAPPSVHPDTTPASGGWRGFLGHLGEALGGGIQGGAGAAMSPRDRQLAGLRALGDFGTGLMAASHYQPGQTAFSNLAGGFQGAERGLLGSEQMAAGTLASQQAYQLEQQKMQMERLKTALPLLQMQQGAGLPNVLLGGGGQTGTGGGGGTGTAIAPPAGAVNPFVGKNLPDGVSPDEDQLVRTVYGEAGNQPLAGQQAVAHVIKTRMGLAGQGVQDTVFAPNQFEAWADPKNRPRMEALDPTSSAYQTILNGVVRPVMSGKAQDPTGGATNFVNPVLQKQLGRSMPSWAQGNQTTIGDHTFYYGGYGKQPTTQTATAQPPGGAQTGGGVAGRTGGTNVAGPGAGGTPGGSVAPSGSGGPAPPTPVGNLGLVRNPDGSVGTPPPSSAATAPPAGTPGKLTFEQWQAQHPMAPTDTDRATWTLTPPDLAGAQAAKQQAAIELSRAQRQNDTRAIGNAQTAFEAADKRVTDAQQSAAQKSAELQQNWQKNALDTQRQLFQAEQDRQQQAELKQQELAQTAAEADKERKAKLDQINAQAGATERTNALNGLNTEAAASAHRLDDVAVLRGLSSNLGNPTFLTTAHIGGQSLADIISAAGVGSDALNTKAGQAQAFRAATLSMVRDLRMGGAATGEPRSNQDLSFITSMVPSEMQSPATRNAIISYIETANQRRMEYAAEVGRLANTPEYRDNVGGAMLAARKGMPDPLMTVPKEIATGGGDIGAQRIQWFRDNVRPGSFYRAPNGRMQVWSGVPGDPDYMAP
jgi:hypothetical protein